MILQANHFLQKPRDKTIWPISLCNFTLMVPKITPSVNYNWWLKRLDSDTQLNKPTNQNPINFTKVVKPTNNKTLSERLWGLV